MIKIKATVLTCSQIASFSKEMPSRPSVPQSIPTPRNANSMGIPTRLVSLLQRTQAIATNENNSKIWINIWSPFKGGQFEQHPFLPHYQLRNGSYPKECLPPVPADPDRLPVTNPESRQWFRIQSIHSDNSKPLDPECSILPARYPESNCAEAAWMSVHWNY